MIEPESSKAPEAKKLILEFILTQAQARILEKEQILDAGIAKLESDRSALTAEQSAFWEDRNTLNEMQNEVDASITRVNTQLKQAEVTGSEADKKLAQANELLAEAQTKVRSIELREIQIVKDRADLDAREQKLSDRTQVFINSVKNGRIDT